MKLFYSNHAINLTTITLVSETSIPLFLLLRPKESDHLLIEGSLIRSGIKI
jgi:hypothetical protein